MTAASVGFHCPDDVRAARASAPRTRTTLTATTVGAPVTVALVAVNVVVFVLQQVRPALQVSYGNLALAQDGGQLIGVAEGQYYRLLTAAFLHAGLFHLLSNMFALATLGPALESALGRGRYLALYVLAAIGGSTLSYLVSSPDQLGVGASGAIFGLFGAYYVVVRRVGGDTGPILGLLAINLVITFAVPIIDWRAHVGGLLVGAVLAGIFAYAPSGRRQPQLQVMGCVAVALVLVISVLVRTAALQA